MNFALYLVYLISLAHIALGVASVVLDERIGVIVLIYQLLQLGVSRRVVPGDVSVDATVNRLFEFAAGIALGLLYLITSYPRYSGW